MPISSLTPQQLACLKGLAAGEPASSSLCPSPCGRTADRSGLVRAPAIRLAAPGNAPERLPTDLGRRGTARRHL